MGSRTDLPVLSGATEVLASLDIPFEARILSANRAPDATLAYARGCRERGIRLLIAGGGGAAHLPGLLAAVTPLPVLAVPVDVGPLAGVDALLSMVQMPKGVPVATFGIGRAGAANAALFAAQVLALTDGELHERLRALRDRRAAEGQAELDLVADLGAKLDNP
jgi:5-(carboxyamino)imidazole ribonucleotide mutase